MVRGRCKTAIKLLLTAQGEVQGKARLSLQKKTPPMTAPLHIALLGDSIFDNARYVPDGLAVTDYLRRCLTLDRITLLATDGDTTRDVSAQLQRLPRDTTHLVLSVGGNDALGWLPTLERHTVSIDSAAVHIHVVSTVQPGKADVLAALQIKKPIYDAQISLL